MCSCSFSCLYSYRTDEQNVLPKTQGNTYTCTPGTLSCSPDIGHRLRHEACKAGFVRLTPPLIPRSWGGTKWIRHFQDEVERRRCAGGSCLENISQESAFSQTLQSWHWGACRSAEAPWFPPGGLSGLRLTVPSVPAALKQGFERQLQAIFCISRNKIDIEGYPKRSLHFQCSELVGEFPAYEKLGRWKMKGSTRSLMD